MTRKMMLSTAAPALGPAAHAQDTMGTYDTDRDGYVSSGGLASHATGAMQTMDADESGGVSAEEFAQGQMSRYDRNNQDGRLDAAEYDASRVGIEALRYKGEEPEELDEAEHDRESAGIEPLQNMGGADDMASAGGASSGEDMFSDVDADGDTLLDHDEYMMSVRDAFGAYDEDGDGELFPE